MSSRTEMLDLLTLPQRCYSEPGPYSQVTEGGVTNFVEWYCHTMENELGGKSMRPPPLVAVAS